MMWICSECLQQYGLNIQDIPLKDINEPRVKTYHTELKRYPAWDENNVTTLSKTMPAPLPGIRECITLR
jgi:hypothetical protein